MMAMSWEAHCKSYVSQTQVGRMQLQNVQVSYFLLFNSFPFSFCAIIWLYLYFLCICTYFSNPKYSRDIFFFMWNHVCIVHLF